MLAQAGTIAIGSTPSASALTSRLWLAALIVLATPVLMAPSLQHDSFELTKLQVDLPTASACTAELSDQMRSKNRQIPMSNVNSICRQLAQAVAKSNTRRATVEWCNQTQDQCVIVFCVDCQIAD